MRLIGITLIVLGVLALIYGGIDYQRNRSVLEVGSLEIEASSNERFPMPLVVGAVVLIGGVAFLWGSRRRI